MAQVKATPTQVKAEGESGIFTGYASVFGNVDSYGDMVVPGAFTESLAAFGAQGAGVPCYWRHNTDDPFMIIGQTLEAHEDEHGLFVRVQLDLETANGKQTYKLLKEGLVRQMSFAYEVLEAGWVDSEEHGSFYELRKLNLFEVSVVPVGANQSTEITTVKSDTDQPGMSVAAARVLWASTL